MSLLSFLRLSIILFIYTFSNADCVLFKHLKYFEPLSYKPLVIPSYIEGFQLPIANKTNNLLKYFSKTNESLTNPKPITTSSFISSASIELLSKSKPVSFHPSPLSIGLSHINSALHVLPSSVSFRAFGRDFILDLERDSDLFTQSALYSSSGSTDLQPIPNTAVKGHLHGAPDSIITGIITQRGLFSGLIQLGDEIWRVDPVEYHLHDLEPEFSESYGFPLPFHSVIYSDANWTRPAGVRLDHSHDQHSRLRRSASSSSHFCGVYSNESLTDSSHEHSQDLNWLHRAGSLFGAQWFRQELSASQASQRRVRRDASKIQGRHTCHMRLMADPTFFARFKQRNPSLDATQIKREILEFLTRHVALLNLVFTRTLFNVSGTLIFIRFRIANITINDTDMCGKGRYNPLDPAAVWCRDNIDYRQVLSIASNLDHSSYCLAYVFTHRDFSEGVLGYAYIGTIGRRRSREQGSSNTGIVTTLNQGQTQSEAMSEITFAHEVGHSFGSHHDDLEPEHPGAVCNEFKQHFDLSRGNYLMHAKASSGQQDNNLKFSACSHASIEKLLNERLLQGWPFIQDSSSFCGNQVVERFANGTGEQCDCGYPETCQDKCCVAKDCKLVKGVSCSPSQGVCCTRNCTFETPDLICRPEDDCNQLVKCSGREATCGAPVPRANGTFCESGTKMCAEGKCVRSVCERIGWEACTVSERDLPARARDGRSGAQLAREVSSRYCALACHPPRSTPSSSSSSSSSGTCLSSVDADSDEVRALAYAKPFLQLLANISAVRKMQPSRKFASRLYAVLFPPGTACNNSEGYCDVFFVCREHYTEGELKRLRKELFSHKTLTKITDWLTRNWILTVLIILGVVIFFGTFIKVCAVHTPSSNPHFAPAVRYNRETLRYIQDTLARRRPRDGQGQVEASSSRRSGGSRSGGRSRSRSRERARGGQQPAGRSRSNQHAAPPVANANNHSTVASPFSVGTEDVGLSMGIPVVPVLLVNNNADEGFPPPPPYEPPAPTTSHFAASPASTVPLMQTHLISVAPSSTSVTPDEHSMRMSSAAQSHETASGAGSLPATTANVAALAQLSSTSLQTSSSASATATASTNTASGGGEGSPVATSPAVVSPTGLPGIPGLPAGGRRPPRARAAAGGKGSTGKQKKAK